MTCKTIRDDVINTQSCYIFDYKGKACGIDPTGDSFDVWYGDDDYNFASIDEVFDAKIFDGKSLKDVVDKIENYEAG